MKKANTREPLIQATQLRVDENLRNIAVKKMTQRLLQSQAEILLLLRHTTTIHAIETTPEIVLPVY